ncbi:MAG: hypothetical protein KIT32_16855 [Rhodocyclaceae bacterium]|nr:hypothetical protein [Rhodocyclaceae bacterium]
MASIIQRLRNLIPNPPLLVGEVISIEAYGAVVELNGGGRLRVRGSATVGAKVYVRGDLIEAEAPDLPGGVFEV